MTATIWKKDQEKEVDFSSYILPQLKTKIRLPVCEMDATGGCRRRSKNVSEDNILEELNTRLG